ncbi:MAG: FG-GAP-like repeat-containing protein [candidate division KSB1 bacterium]|nr:FG-GAP-like repeat-containing protein [candidate division KSB1 bacterium]MDZ7336179.1 FG-GAP-like repeat-containing protein [candidate division KSB1 bacterium]MDZ7358160.1 FG-GAP-like repeat-containing protein [candidate division KSB1 bacterium]MDZ7375296.1 FG-GAP-like repeat-containing protein [candidate division KSB1 bacterium]MDZ7401992.1 FG-GAP-like repeat-containing protein [candidate division KSB1 bacterium]
MRGKIGTILLLVALALMFSVADNFAQPQFVRKAEIPIPEANLNNGGTGNMIAGTDIDKDGRVEIFLVNDNWNDGPTELIPRIYKLEKDGENWVVVWKATANIPKQNTWPCFTMGDLDKDGKPELYWGPVNFLEAGNENPPRILVFESKGDGSDEMGVPDGTGNYLPNAKWTIATENNQNIRPMRWVIADPDNDGTEELIFADRTGKSGAGYFCGVVSVSNIPDNGDGSETWTLEVSGLDFNLKSGTAQNKWDVAVIGPHIYSFCENEITKFTWDGSAWQYDALPPMAGGSPNQSCQVVDLNKDGVKEIILAVYDWGNDAYKGIYLLQEDADSLKRTELVNMAKYWPSGSRGPWGSAAGDIDGDGHLDFVFGSRASTPNAAIFRLAYRGGDITDPANYEFAMIDSMYADGGIWTVLNIANVDDDPEMEVLYTSSTDAGTFPNMGTQPIVVLDYVGPKPMKFDNLIVAPEVLFNGQPPTGLLFKPGRILDNGQTIWFCGVNATARETYVFRSIDGGKTFTHNTTPIKGRAAQVDAFDANTALVADAEGKIYKTVDGGATWVEKHSYMISVIAPGWFDGIRVLDENTAVAFGDFEPNGNMYFVRSTDKGETWTQIPGINFLGAAYAYYTWGTAACTVGPKVWLAATNMEYNASFVFRSFDLGVTWESFTIPVEVIPNYPRSIAFSDENNGMIAARGGYVIMSTDGGATWSPTDNPVASTDSYVNSVVAIPNSNIILAMDDLGVFYTTDLGATWGQINTPAELDPDDFVGGVFLNKDFGYVFTYGGKVLRFENQITRVSEPRAHYQPKDFSLEQNYPNPFNPSTTITFSIARAERVTLNIYNLMGEHIKTLVDGSMMPGSYSVQWDGTDMAGNKVSSGTYLYTLWIGNQQLTRKMLFLK